MMLTASSVAVLLATAACADLPAQTHNGLVGGRVLVAPGAALVGAHVVVDQVNLYDGKAELRKHVGDAVTDDQGAFAALPTGTINGLILIDASGGTYTDPINGARIQLDPSVHLKALHWLGLFEDRGASMYVTPIHALVEARFRYKMTVLGDTVKAANDAYAHLDAHFGGLDWEKVIPADLTMAVPSPTDEVRAAFVLGGLAVLAEDLRTASHSTPQVVNIMTFVDAAERDLADQWLDGNDANDGTLGSGLQVGDCPAVTMCSTPPGVCPLGACRASCDIYANTYRNITAESISKFIGPKLSPSNWNHTTLSSDDARAFTDSITRDVDSDLFNDTCVEPQHRLPPTILWDMSPADRALQGGQITLHVHAIDGDSNKLPTVSFQNYPDSDGDPFNDFATTTIDTRTATGSVDGLLTVTAIATGASGNLSTSTRTFQIDNTPPVVTLDSNGLYVDAANIWWTATPGPTLHGTVSDAHGLMQVTMMIGGSVVATAVVDGTQWTAQLPANALSASGNDVTIVATDPAGNVATKVQTLRIDTTPPSVAVEPSPVSDEINSLFEFIDGPTGSFAEHRLNSNILPVDLSTTTACPTLHKYGHLLFAPLADGVTHSVLGSSGALNPLQLNAIVSDDGVGIRPGSTEYRVLYNSGTSFDEILPWTPMPAPSGSQRRIPLYRDVIPQLATTNGEYHIQLHATDQFGRTTTQERCWQHIILAPPLRPTSTRSPGGDPAKGFQRALFSTKLSPGTGETGDFAEKFLNANPAGAAVWRTRFQNYLGLPVYVTVQISRDVGADISREFRVMKSLTNFEGPSQPILCGNRHCVSNPPPASIAEYVSSSTPVHVQLAFRSRLFTMVGNETGTEAGPCLGTASPCRVSGDDALQTWLFLIPARTAPQGSALPEYAFLTYLRPDFPPENGTNVTLAPSDAGYPDADPAPYTEFMFEGVALSGKLMGGIFDFDQICVSEDVDSGGFFCTVVASHQRYRALSRITVQISVDVVTNYAFSASPVLSTKFPVPGILTTQDSLWSTIETVLP